MEKNNNFEQFLSNEAEFRLFDPDQIGMSKNLSCSWDVVRAAVENLSDNSEMWIDSDMICMLLEGVLKKFSANQIKTFKEQFPGAQEIIFGLHNGGYLIIQETEGGYDYTFCDEDKVTGDGGVLDTEEDDIFAVAKSLAEEDGLYIMSVYASDESVYAALDEFAQEKLE